MSSRVRVLTYNVYMRVTGVNHGCKDLGNDSKDLRLPELSKVLDDYDVVLLQELWNGFSLVRGKKRRNVLIEQAKQLGFEHSVTPPKVFAKEKKLMDSGLVILSRFPIVEEDSLTYSASCNYDRYAAKGALFAKLKLPNGELLNVVNTHLQASYDIVENYSYFKTVDVRNKQLLQLREFVKRKTFPTEAKIVGGDFNINSIESEDVPPTLEFTNMIDDVFAGFSSALGRGEEPTISVYQDPATKNEVSCYVPRVCKNCAKSGHIPRNKKLKTIQMCLDHVLFQNTDVEECKVVDFPLPGTDLFLSDHMALSVVFTVEPHQPDDEAATASSARMSKRSQDPFPQEEVDVVSGSNEVEQTPQPQVEQQVQDNDDFGDDFEV